MSWAPVLSHLAIAAVTGAALYAVGRRHRLTNGFNRSANSSVGNVTAKCEQHREDSYSLLESVQLANGIAGLAVWDWDIVNDTLHVDDFTKARLGASAVAASTSDARGSFLSRVHPEDRAETEAALSAAITDAEIFSHRYRVQLPGSNATRHAQCRAYIERDAQGKAVRMVGISLDVTAEVERTEELHRRAEQERALRDRLNLATQTAGIGVWHTDLISHEMHVDECMRELFGIAGTFDLQTVQERIHPDDRAYVEQTLQRQASCTDPTQITPIRHRIVMSDQSIRHIQAHMRVTCDAAGNPVRVLGVAWDVTIAAEHEKELRLQAANVQALVQRMSVANKAAGVSAWEIDAETNEILWLDNRLPGITSANSSPAEYQAALRNMIDPDDFRETQCVRAASIASGAPAFSCRFRLVRLDGMERHIQTYTHITRDERGKPLSLMTAMIDVTNEVQTTGLLQRQAEKERGLRDRLSMATQAAGIRSWEMDLIHPRLTWFDNVDLDTGGIVADNTLNDLLQTLHSEDRDVFQQAIANALQNGSDLISCRLRIQDAAGNWHHQQNYARLILDEHGTPTQALGVSWDVTGEVEAARLLEQQAKQLRNAEHRLERASLSSSEGHWDWDFATDQVWYSASYHTLLGYRQGELPTDAHSGRLLHHTDDLLWQRALLDAHIHDGTPFDYECRLRRCNGEFRWFRIRGTADRDASGKAIAMAGSLQDIHQQKLAENALKLAQQRLERAIHGTQDGLWELEGDGTAWCSPRVGELLGYAGDAFSSQTNFLRTFLHPDDAVAVAIATQAHFQEEKPYDVEIRLQTRSGNYRWYRARAIAERDPNGRPIRLSGSLQDVTEQRTAHEELLRATAAAEAASRAKSEFLANVSHEIRTPMNGIIGMTGLLLDTPMDRTQRDYAETIRGSADSLLIVINDILDFSKIEAGKLCIESIELDLRSAVEDVGSMLAFQASSKKLELVLHVHPDLPQRVIGDPQRIRQCLINLVSNAIKFTARGEIVVEVRNVGQRDGKILAQFEVRDTGIGIAADTLQALFQPFVQADSSTTRHFGGTGLGLSIVRRMIEMMGGAVGVESELGVGSTFWFTLPVEAVVPSRDCHSVDLTSHGRRVLIVDDNETNRRVLAGQLMHAGYDVSLAGGGNEALQMMYRGLEDNHRYDVVLADYQLHDMDGATLGERINGDPRVSGARLVILTSLDRHGDIHRFASLGFAGYLTKPVRSRELLECLARLLSANAKEWHLQSQPIVTTGMLAATDKARRYQGNVLLVEDNAVNQKVAVRFLERMGCRVRVADNGAEGVKSFREGKFDIVLMDLQMPVMDGLMATREIRTIETQRPNIPPTPIIALTANAMAGQVERCIEAGMNAFLTKPLEVARLHETFERFGLALNAATTDGAAGAVPDSPVDLARLHEITEGDAEFAYELVSTFVVSSQQVMQEVAEAMAALDRAALGRAAHKLKGASANIHAAGIRQLAEDLESQSSSVDQSRLQELIEQLHREFISTTNFLQQHVPVPTAQAS